MQETIKTELRLRQHKLRPTDIRKRIIELFLQHDYALSHMDVLSALPPGSDRVTVYRNLTAFLNNGLLHRVQDDSGIARYALCDDHNCSVHKHRDEHLHFHCAHCDRIFCLSVVTLPEIDLPAGYQLDSFTMLAEGICPECRSGTPNHD